MSKKKHQIIIDDAWLGLGDLSKLDIKHNPLLDQYKSSKHMPGLHEIRIMRDPMYLHYAAKVLLGITLLPEQAGILRELWIRPFPMYIASRGFGKSFTLALYAILRCALVPGTKCVIVGAAFRQSKVVFEYMESIWYNAPVLRSVVDGGPRKEADRYMLRIGSSWAQAIPLGDGSKIRGLRAHIIIADEFGSIPPAIYEQVVAGFTAVSADPVGNVKESARRKKAKELGTWTTEQELKYTTRVGNQAILSGTASYDFEHFADYWKRYKAIIQSRGDPNKLAQIFGEEDEINESFNWKDYSIIRIPYELIPQGFMDDRHVIRAKATMHSGIYQMEYGAVFTSDSDGFFKRSLINSCVSSDIKPINLSSGPVWFDAATTGQKHRTYVLGIDPASEVDNFTIVVLELHPDHTRVVYCWATNKVQFKERLRKGLTNEHDFYGYCARKIRDLIAVFPVPDSQEPSIGIDAQGGGISVIEALQDPDKMLPGEKIILPWVDPDKKKDTDHLPGRHIIIPCQFANYEWTSNANHGLRKDLEDQALLFPRFDPVALEIAAGIENVERESGNQRSLYDSLEDCVMEIEELKDELATIVITRTGTGVNSRDRWDTPEIKLSGGKKGRLRKDRYSALVMANMIARNIHRSTAPVSYPAVGGFADEIKGKFKDEPLYGSGPDWFMKEMKDLGGMAVRKNKK